MNPQLAHDLIRKACNRREDLRWKDQAMWERVKDFQIKFAPYQGYCYIASHTFSFLTAAEVWSTQSGSHYWNVLNGEVWDLTKEQFNYDFPYNIGGVKRRRMILNRTKRVQELLNDIERNS